MNYFNYFNFIKYITDINNSIDNNIHQEGGGNNSRNYNDRIIPLLQINYNRAMAFDDKEKKKKRGIYRVKYEDKNDLDKAGNPKIKFNYFYLKDNKLVSDEDQIRINKFYKVYNFNI